MSARDHAENDTMPHRCDETCGELVALRDRDDAREQEAAQRVAEDEADRDQAAYERAHGDSPRGW